MYFSDFGLGLFELVCYIYHLGLLMLYCMFGVFGWL